MLLYTKLKFADILLDSLKRNDAVLLGGQHKHSWIALQVSDKKKNAAEQIYSNMLSHSPTTANMQCKPVLHQVSPKYRYVIKDRLGEYIHIVAIIKSLLF